MDEFYMSIHLPVFCMMQPYLTFRVIMQTEHEGKTLFMQSSLSWLSRQNQTKAASHFCSPAT